MKPRKSRQLAPEESRILTKKAKKRHGFLQLLRLFEWPYKWTILHRRNELGLHLKSQNEQIIALESDKSKQDHQYPQNLSECIQKIPKNMQSSQSSPQSIWPRKSHKPIEDTPTRIQDRKGKSSQNPCQISQSEKFQNKPQLKQAPPENQTAKEPNPSLFRPLSQPSTRLLSPKPQSPQPNK